MTLTPDEIAVLTAMQTMGELRWVEGSEEAVVFDLHSDAVVELDGSAASELLRRGLVEPAIPSDRGKATWYLTEAGTAAAESVVSDQAH